MRYHSASDDAALSLRAFKRQLETMPHPPSAAHPTTTSEVSVASTRHGPLHSPAQAAVLSLPSSTTTMASNNVAFAAPLALGKSAASGTSLTCVRTGTPAPVLAARSGAPRMSFTSIGGVLTDAPTSTTSDDLSTVVARVMNQVFGNAHVMESESAELSSIVSQFVMCKDVREFVRSLAKSSQYKTRFLEAVSMYRATELAFKHVLGRAPADRVEYAQAMAAYHTGGFDNMVDLLVDSTEYDELFGMAIVPELVYKGVWPVNQCFNYSVAITLPPSASDKGRSSLLQYAICSGDAPNWLSIVKGLPAGTEKGTGFQFTSYKAASKINDRATVRVGTKVPGGVVFY